MEAQGPDIMPEIGAERKHQVRLTLNGQSAALSSSDEAIFNGSRKRKYAESGLPKFGHNENGMMSRKRLQMDTHSEHLEGLRPPISSSLLSGIPPH